MCKTRVGYRQWFQIREQGGEGGLGVVGGGGGYVDVYKLFTRAEGKKKSNTMSKKWIHLFSTHKETSRTVMVNGLQIVQSKYRSLLEDVGWQAKKEQGLGNHTETKIANTAKTFWNFEFF